MVNHEETLRKFRLNSLYGKFGQMTKTNRLCPFCKTIVSNPANNDYDCYLINNEYWYIHRDCLRKLVLEALEKEALNG